METIQILGNGPAAQLNEDSTVLNEATASTTATFLTAVQGATETQDTTMGDEAIDGDEEDDETMEDEEVDSDAEDDVKNVEDNVEENVEANVEDNVEANVEDNVEDDDEDIDEDTDENQDGVPWEDLSASNCCSRYQAVRNRMGQHVLSVQTILDHLSLANGSVDNAVDSLQRAHSRALAGVPAATGEINLPSAIKGVPIQYFATADQERRAAAGIMPLLANLGRDKANQIVLSRAQAALLLEVADGDMDQVVVLLENYNESMQTLHRRYDGLRALTGTEKERQEQADAALAHLIHMTNRPDWYSVGLHLAAHQWDLVKAVAVWQEIGILPQKHKQDKPGKVNEGKGRRKVRSPTGLITLPMPTLAECTEYKSRSNIPWGPEPAQFANTAGPAAAQPGTVRQGSKARKGRPFSFVIHHDTTTAKAHCPDETKMLIEYIAAGKYRTNAFKSVLYRWPGFPQPNDAHKPLFDFGAQKDVQTLNSWSRENYLRITGMINRPGGSPWSAEEKSYLYDLCGRLYGEQSLAKNQDPIKFYVPRLTAEAWVLEYKTRFGTERTASGILNMARRDPKLCNDFGLSWNDGDYRR